MDAKLSAPVTISSNGHQWLSGSGVDQLMSTWIIPYPVTSQLTRAGLVTWSISISFTQPPLCWSNMLVWNVKDSYWMIILLRKYSHEKESLIESWENDELSLQIPIVILCLLSFVTTAPGATLLQPWEWRQWRVIYKSSRRYLSAKFPITFDKNAPVQICLDKNRVAIMLFVCNQIEFFAR